MLNTIVYRDSTKRFVHTVQVKTSQLRKELRRLRWLGAIIDQVSLVSAGRFPWSVPAKTPSRPRGV
jgi:hypothetical protein